MDFYKRFSNVVANLRAPKGQFNQFGKYKYRSCEDILNAVKPLLSENGLLLNLSDNVIQVGDRYYINATATVFDATSDGRITSTAVARESLDKKGMDDSQISGTASSYARKYALNGLFCIDDTKDADTDEYHKTTAPAPSEQNSIECDSCGKTFKPKLPISEYKKKSRSAWGGVYCPECGKGIDAIGKMVQEHESQGK